VPSGLRGSKNPSLNLQRPFFLRDTGEVILLQYFFGQVQVIHGAFAVGIVEDHGLAETRGFAEAGVANTLVGGSFIRCSVSLEFVYVIQVSCLS
jgi:hypothetical protein